MVEAQRRTSYSTKPRPKSYPSIRAVVVANIQLAGFLHYLVDGEVKEQREAYSSQMSGRRSGLPNWHGTVSCCRRCPDNSWPTK